MAEITIVLLQDKNGKRFCGRGTRNWRNLVSKEPEEDPPPKEFSPKNPNLTILEDYPRVLGGGVTCDIDSMTVTAGEVEIDE